MSTTPSATAFAHAFETAFRTRAKTAPFGEVALFGAMMKAFSSLKPHFYLEEFHGFKRQVYFDTVHPWMRARARCELCDVLFVTHSVDDGISVRMTLLQAKRSQEVHSTCLPAHAGKIEPQTFAGNFEQWDLLCRRPSLDPTSAFEPPPTLLSSAILASIGSFGIFFRNGSGLVDLFYVSADCIDTQGKPKGPNARLGKLRTTTGSASRYHFGWHEATYCPSAREFAAALYRMEIGTPILQVSPSVARRQFDPQLDWVRRVIATHLAEVDSNAPLTRALLTELGSAEPLPHGAPVPNLVVLRGTQARN